MSKLGEAINKEGREKQIKLMQIKNMFTDDREVKIRVKNSDKRHPVRVVQGKVIQTNNFLVAIRTKNRVESFNYIDFLTGQARVI